MHHGQKGLEANRRFPASHCFPDHRRERSESLAQSEPPSLGGAALAGLRRQVAPVSRRERARLGPTFQARVSFWFSVAPQDRFARNGGPATKTAPGAERGGRAWEAGKGCGHPEPHPSLLILQCSADASLCAPDGVAAPRARIPVGRTDKKPQLRPCHHRNASPPRA